MGRRMDNEVDMWVYCSGVGMDRKEGIGVIGMVGMERIGALGFVNLDRVGSQIWIGLGDRSDWYGWD